MKPDTQFIETEALLHAMQDAEAHSGNTDMTDDYLRENFLTSELRALTQAAELLAERAWIVYREKAMADLERQ